MFYKFTPAAPYKNSWDYVSNMIDFHWYKGKFNDLWCKNGPHFIRLEHGQIHVFHSNDLDTNYVVEPFERGTLEVTLNLDTCR